MWNHSDERREPPGTGTNSPMQMNEIGLIVDLSNDVTSFSDAVDIANKW